MAIDITICIIVFISAVCYAHIGFTRTVISTVQWVLCIVCGLFFADDIRDLIYKTGIGKGMENSIASALSEKAEEAGIFQSIPAFFRNLAGNAADYSAKQTAISITSIILTVFAFLAIIFGIKIVLFVITHLLSKKYHDGPVAFIDSAGGLILGVALGVLYVFIALAVLVLVLHFLPDSTSDQVLKYLDSSYFSGILYDNNPLLMLLDLF